MKPTLTLFILTIISIITFHYNQKLSIIPILAMFIYWVVVSYNWCKNMDR